MSFMFRSKTKAELTQALAACQAEAANYGNALNAALEQLQDEKRRSAGLLTELDGLRADFEAAKKAYASRSADPEITRLKEQNDSLRHSISCAEARRQQLLEVIQVMVTR